MFYIEPFFFYMCQILLFHLGYLMSITLLMNCLSYYFESQHVDSFIHFKNIVKCRLKDQFLQNWQAIITDSPFAYYIDCLKKNLVLRNI